MARARVVDDPSVCDPCSENGDGERLDISGWVPAVYEARSAIPEAYGRRLRLVAAVQAPAFRIPTNRVSSPNRCGALIRPNGIPRRPHGRGGRRECGAQWRSGVLGRDGRGILAAMMAAGRRSASTVTPPTSSRPSSPEPPAECPWRHGPHGRWAGCTSTKSRSIGPPAHRQAPLGNVGGGPSRSDALRNRPG